MDSASMVKEIQLLVTIHFQFIVVVKIHLSNSNKKDTTISSYA